MLQLKLHQISEIGFFPLHLVEVLPDSCSSKSVSLLWNVVKDLRQKVFYFMAFPFTKLVFMYAD